MSPTSSAQPPAPKVAEGSRRSHPPSLLRCVERALRDHNLVPRGSTVLCACSGGPDSTALLHALARLRDKFAFCLVAHGIDHGLRDEASAELSIAEALAQRLEVPFSTTKLALRDGGNLQARARAARLDALAHVAADCGARHIATAHTADDRAETFLLRLLRGAGPRGLAVLPATAPLGRDGITLIRPLLLARRSDVMAHLKRHALAYASDPSNHNPRFARVRVRKELLPLMAELSPGIVEHLCALAGILENIEPAAELPPGFAPQKRAHWQAIDRAERLGRHQLTVRIKGGEDVLLDLPKVKPVLIHR